MKKLISWLLIITVLIFSLPLAAAGSMENNGLETQIVMQGLNKRDNLEKPDFIELDLVDPEFSSLNSEGLLQYLEDDIYEALELQLGSEDYEISGVSL
ncbi:MAG: hypothetical protein Q4B26_19685, partial [Eubacteriales bacterium]|nr:hypothetical protein [Eubacteriales bacterium]